MTNNGLSQTITNASNQISVQSFFDFSKLIQIPNNFSELIFSTILVVCLAFILCLVYRKTYSGKDFKPSFLQALFIISILLSFIMQVIGNSLARAFGMMGAVSIARFRTKVNDAKDTSFVLFAIAIGMSCGLGHYVLSILMTIVTSLVIIIFFSARTKITPSNMGIIYLLVITLKNIDKNKELLEELLDKHEINYSFITFDHTEEFSLTYKIRFKKKADIPLLYQDLKSSLGENLSNFTCTHQDKINY